MNKKIKVNRLEVKNKPPPNSHNKLLKQLKQQGLSRQKLFDDHRSAVDDSYKLVMKARQAGVPVGKIAEASGLSRQWISKMGSYSGRSKPKKRG